MTIAQQLRQEGRQEGLQKGLHESILEVLEVRFGPVPVGLRDAIETIQDETRLRGLRKASLQAASLENFSRSL